MSTLTVVKIFFVKFCVNSVLAAEKHTKRLTQVRQYSCFNYSYFLTRQCFLFYRLLKGHLEIGEKYTYISLKQFPPTLAEHCRGEAKAGGASYSVSVVHGQSANII